MYIFQFTHKGQLCSQFSPKATFPPLLPSIPDPCRWIPSLPASCSTYFLFIITYFCGHCQRGKQGESKTFHFRLNRGNHPGFFFFGGFHSIWSTWNPPEIHPRRGIIPKSPRFIGSNLKKSRRATLQINVPLPSSFLIQKQKKKLISLPPVWDMSPLIIRVVPGAREGFITDHGKGIIWLQHPKQEMIWKVCRFLGVTLETDLMTFCGFYKSPAKKKTEGKKSKCFGMLSQRDKCSPNCSCGEEVREEKLHDKRYSSSRNL